MIKYECEKCEREVYTEEAIGADVYLGDTRGTSFTFTDFIGGTITITYEDKNAGLQQFCHACMFETIVQCLREKFDEETLIKMMGFAYKLLGGPKRTIDFLVDANRLADQMFDQEGERAAEIDRNYGPVRDFAAPAASARIDNALGFPPGPFTARIVPPPPMPEGDLYASTDTGDPGEDHELSELYASGQLPVPRSDITAERPVRQCICTDRGPDGKFTAKNPACPVHSPGGSSG